MNFVGKNFSYVTKTMAEFAHEIEAGSRLYLRALSSETPTDLPADLHRDFPTLASDFILPPALAFVVDNAFSSVLRIAGPVNMWLHYDVSSESRILKDRSMLIQ
jgi:tRNA wybutosine-synthesizing protein 4